MSGTGVVNLTSGTPQTVVLLYDSMALVPSSSSSPPPSPSERSRSDCPAPPQSIDRHASDALLTAAVPRRPLPLFWGRLIPSRQRAQVQRMYVLGDGSCA